jgi:hypothetical protein
MKTTNKAMMKILLTGDTKAVDQAKLAQAAMARTVADKAGENHASFEIERRRG